MLPLPGCCPGHSLPRPRYATGRTSSLVSTIPLPFCRCRFGVPFCRFVVTLPFFPSVATVFVTHENGNAGNVFPYRDEETTMLIGCLPTAERQKYDSILLLRNGSYGTTAGGNGNGAMEFFT